MSDSASARYRWFHISPSPCPAVMDVGQRAHLCLKYTLHCHIRPFFCPMCCFLLCSYSILCYFLSNIPRTFFSMICPPSVKIKNMLSYGTTFCHLPGQIFYGSASKFFLHSSVQNSNGVPLQCDSVLLSKILSFSVLMIGGPKENLYCGGCLRPWSPATVGLSWQQYAEPIAIDVFLNSPLKGTVSPDF